MTTFTTIAGAEAAVEGMKYMDNLDVYSLQELHAQLASQPDDRHDAPETLIYNLRIENNRRSATLGGFSFDERVNVMATIPITKRGAEKLKAELHQLKTVDRPWVINAIAEARAQGDLSENAEYDAAKDRQGFIEGRIQEIEGKLVGRPDHRSVGASRPAAGSCSARPSSWRKKTPARWSSTRSSARTRPT